MGWPPADWLDMTLRELVIAHDAWLLERWDHTTCTMAALENLTLLVSSIGGKSRPKFVTPLQRHPYRKHQASGLAIRSDNIGMLKAIGNSLCRK